MDIGRFQANLTNLVNGGVFKGKDAEKAKEKFGLQTQMGPAADTVEINFAQLDKVSGDESTQVADLVSRISEMSLDDAKAELSNPEIFETLVEAGIPE
jgi:hypothetical protein